MTPKHEHDSDKLLQDLHEHTLPGDCLRRSTSMTP